MPGKVPMVINIYIFIFYALLQTLAAFFRLTFPIHSILYYYRGAYSAAGMPLSHIQCIRIGNSFTAVYTSDMLIHRSLTYVALAQPRSRYNNGFIIKGNTSCATTAPIPTKRRNER